MFQMTVYYYYIQTPRDSLLDPNTNFETFSLKARGGSAKAEAGRRVRQADGESVAELGRVSF